MYVKDEPLHPQITNKISCGVRRLAKGSPAYPLRGKCVWISAGIYRSYEQKYINSFIEIDHSWPPSKDNSTAWLN